MAIQRVLVIDDEPAILRIVKESLQEKFEVILALSGLEGIAKTMDERPDLIIVDNIMPGMSGVEVVKTLRQASSANQTPIIMLTALKESVDRIEAFKAGVDDFISKPFNPDELLTRVSSKLNRFESIKNNKQKSFVLGNLSLNMQNHEVKINSSDVHLTRIELAILYKLILEKDNMVSRQALANSIWTEPSSKDRILDIHIATLRKKIDDFDHKIETIYSKGYIIRSLSL